MRMIIQLYYRNKRKMEKMKVLFIFAHPDDVEIYCGGLLNKLYVQGEEIKVCCVAERQQDGVYENARKREMYCSMELVKIKPDFMNIQDGRVIWKDYELEKLKAYIYSYNPDLIITHNQKDYHFDHRHVSEVVHAAASYKYPVLMSDTLCGNDHEPEFFCEITKYMKRKIEMLSCYKSQLNICDYLHMVQILNAFRFLQYTGKVQGYCEGYSFGSRYQYRELENIVDKLFKKKV